jgi:hypothetical protein
VREWEEDESQDFSKLVDSPKVFQFINEVKKFDEKWMFPFETSNDICHILKNQIAFLFSDSLRLRLKAQTSCVPSDLMHLRGRALEILIERELGWEYLFFGQMLKDELLKQEDFRNDWKYHVVVGPSTVSKAREFVSSISDRIQEGYRLLGNLTILITEVFPHACGPIGKTGNASEIAYVARRLALVYLDTLKWKLELRSLVVHEEILNLRNVLADFLDALVEEFDRWSAEYFEKAPAAVKRAQRGEKTELNLMFKPAALDPTHFGKELNRVAPLIASGKLEE